MKRSNLENFTELGQFELDAASIRMLPLRFCREHHVVVLGRVMRGSAEPITLGMLNPQEGTVLHDVARRLNRQVRPARLTSYEVEKALHFGYGRPDVEDNVITWVETEPGPETPVPQMLNHILADAVQKGASDIHLETYRDDVDLRLRIDGILHQVFTHITPANINEIISRLKVMCELDITERRKPQDGRLRATIILPTTRKEVDFRVSVVPSPVGEDVVIRVLDSSQGLISIEQLGMPPAMQVVFLRLLSNPEGLILVTGPTGSGKTTTLYSALSHMRDGRRKIMTAEDPIEYYIDKVNQKQVTAGMTMASLSRALLRQDPDVMLFGEIRDHEMGNMALMAAETGHVVLSTLHTSDAVGAIVRLRGLGLENADIANSLLGSVGQRLMRRICPHCAEPTLPTDAQAAMLGELLDGLQFFEGRGCARCFGTGYKGRVGVYELLLLDEGLQDLIAEGSHKSVLRRYVMGNGFRTLVDDALGKVSAGLTTVDEIIRVIPYRQLILARQDRLEKRKALQRRRSAARSASAAASVPTQTLPRIQALEPRGAEVPTAPEPPPPSPEASVPVGRVQLASMPALEQPQPLAQEADSSAPVSLEPASEPAAPPQEESAQLAEPAQEAPSAPWEEPPAVMRELPEASLDIEIDVDEQGGIQSFGFGSGLQVEQGLPPEGKTSGQDLLAWIDPAQERQFTAHGEQSLDSRSTHEVRALEEEEG